MRHGRGKQIWPDSSVFEGYWFEDATSTKGRLFLCDGDNYEGD